MFAHKLENPLPLHDPVPPDIFGRPDYNPKHYVYTQDGGGRYRAFHILMGCYCLIGLGVLLSVLSELVREEGGFLPRNPMDLLLQFPELRVDEMNYQSEHLLVTLGYRIINWAAFANLVKAGEDPFLFLEKWIHDSIRYEAHRLTYMTGARFDVRLSLPTVNPIREYIENCVNDAETSKLLHFFFALCLIGWQTVKMILIIVGPKNAGKTALFTLICKVFGTYAVTFPPSYFLPSNEDRLAKELFTSQGVRFLRVDELGKDSVFNETMIKRMTGRDGIKNPFVTSSVRIFYPQCKVFCDSNYPLKPQYGTESTISDRTFYIPFGKVIPKEERDPFFVEKIATQENLDIYFSWLIRHFAMDAITGRLS